MVIVILSDCPPRLRGELSKWMLEINSGVFVGNISARVRDQLWQLICSNIKKWSCHYGLSNIKRTALCF